MTPALLFTPVLSSRLAPLFAGYVELKRALGLRFDFPARTLQSLDRFLCDPRALFLSWGRHGAGLWRQASSGHFFRHH